MSLFLGSQYYSIYLCVYPYASTHCFDYYCFVVCFEVWKCESSNVVFICQYYFDMGLIFPCSSECLILLHPLFSILSTTHIAKCPKMHVSSGVHLFS